MMTFKSNEFDRRVLLLMDCGTIKDKNWADKEVKKRMRFSPKTVGEDTEGYDIYNIFDIICAIKGG